MVNSYARQQFETQM